MARPSWRKDCYSKKVHTVEPEVMVEHGFSYYSVGRPAALTEEPPTKMLAQKKDRA